MGMKGSGLGVRLVRRALVAAVVCAVAVPFPWVPADAATVSATYSQPVNFEWDRKTLDVLIVPPLHGQLVNGRRGTRLLNGGDLAELNPIANSYIAALTHAITDWRRAIKSFGSRSLRQLKLNVYVVGRDVVPPAALQQPEIIFTWDETKGPILGSASQFYVGESSSPCIIQNSMIGLDVADSFSTPDMYNIAGHEFGHCLGVDHTFGAKGVQRDLMYANYGADIGLEDNPLKCISNLNVRTLELVYDGRSQPSAVTMPVREYKQMRCA
jgi:hypothetical protein